MDIAGVERASVERAVERLERAARSGVACEPLTDVIQDGDIATAYRVQSALSARRVDGGARRIGRKIGLTSEAVQRQVGVEQPDFGVLFDDMRFRSGGEIPFSRLLQPKAEAEIAFVLAHDVLDPVDAEGARAAVDLAFAAIEIVDSRISGWRIGIADTVADNASSGVFVLADEGVPIDRFEPADVRMHMLRNGQTVSSGSGRDCLGDPLNALAWLARTAIEFGEPLRAGDIVLSGALGPMADVSPGDEIVASIDPLGTVTISFSGRTAA